MEKWLSRFAHNEENAGSNPAAATSKVKRLFEYEQQQFHEQKR